jgi:hypothetical protein
MSTNARKIRRAMLAPLFMGLVLAVACDDEDDPDPSDSIVAMNLIIGNSAITVSESGAITGGPAIIQTSGVPISATFVNSSGNVVAGLNDFELRVTSENTGRVTFTRVSAFAGTLNRIAAGTTNLKIGLYHVLEGHFDFGEFTIPLNVQ